MLRAWQAELERPSGQGVAREAPVAPEFDLIEARRVVGLKGVASADSLADVLGCGSGQTAAAIASSSTRGSPRSCLAGVFA